MVGNPTVQENHKRNQFKAGWAYALVIVASLILIGMPFLGPLFFVVIPILFIMTIPALVYFYFKTRNKSEQNTTSQ